MSVFGETLADHIPNLIKSSAVVSGGSRIIRSLPLVRPSSRGSNSSISSIEMGNTSSKGKKEERKGKLGNLLPTLIVNDGELITQTELIIPQNLPIITTPIPLFGNIGQQIIQSLQNSNDHLLDSLHLSKLHSLESSNDHDHDCCTEDLDDSDNFRERGAEMMDRGGNKKKRKIPGLTNGLAGNLEDERIEDRDYPSEKSLARATANEELISHSTPFPKPPPPDSTKTVEEKLQAALRVLNYRRIHISLCSRALSYRKHQQRTKRDRQKYPPIVDLPQVVPYFAPAGYSTTIGVVKGGAKGSKGLKLARKAEKDREKANEQMKSALGGASIKLPDFCDPLGHLAIAARALKRAQLKAKSSYPTPPSSSDERDSSSSAYSSSVPSQESFDYVSVPTTLIMTRWEALQAQLERIILMKAKALQARTEESENRNRKEAEAVKSLEEARKTSVDGKKSSKGNRPTPRPTTASTTATPSDCSSDCHKHSHPSSSPPTISSPQDLFRKIPIKKGRRKRSALANEGNSHHRDNYIPSRIPAVPTTLPPTNPSESLTSWPAAPELIAQLSATQSSRNECGSTPNSLLDFFSSSSNKEEDYICTRCDYQIFFGEKSWLERAVRKKKKGLKKGREKRGSREKTEV